MRPNVSTGSVSIAIYALALIQKAFRETFSGSIWFSAMAFSLCLSCIWMGKQIGNGIGRGFGTTFAIASAGLAASLMPYTAPFIGSFYGEAIFIVTFPAVVGFFVAGRKMTNVALLMMLLVVTACATAKAQIFYLPALMLVLRILFGLFCYLTMPHKRYFGILVASQILSLLPVLAGDYQQVNSHNSKYMGAYLATTPDELREMAIDPLDMACIGSDYWGNRIDFLKDTNPSSGAPCRSVNETMSLEIARIYINNPALLFRIVATAVPVHGTVDYFHLSKDNLYEQRTESSRPGIFLEGISAIRKRAISGLGIVWIPCVLATLSLCILPRSVSAMLVFFLAIVVSQIAVVVVGEGVRDLSKHLLIAQYSVDIGVAVFICALVAFFFRSAWGANPRCRTRPPERRALRNPQNGRVNTIDV